MCVCVLQVILVQTNDHLTKIETVSQQVIKFHFIISIRLQIILKYLEIRQITPCISRTSQLAQENASFLTLKLWKIPQSGIYVRSCEFTNKYIFSKTSYILHMAAKCSMSFLKINFGKPFLSLGFKRPAVTPLSLSPVFINKPKQIWSSHGHT